jgi:putative transposase
MCEVLGVSRSGYYKWKNSPPSERKKRRAELTKRIEHHHQDSNGIYGSPKITEKLRQEGMVVGEKTVSRIMKENDIRSITAKKFNVQTTDSNHSFPIAPNWLNQHFDI